MRQDTDQSIALFGSQQVDFDHESTPPLLSLRELLPTARFFAGTDIEYSNVAQSAETATAGQLVIYRLGRDCPVKLVAEAMARGAAGILTEQILPSPLPQCVVGDVELAMADLASAHLQRPDRRLLTVGLVGSSGKTTTALLIASLLRDAGIRCAFQTDLGDCDGVLQTTSAEPMPRGADLIHWLDEAQSTGSQAAIIELTDEHLRGGQYDAIEFDVLVITASATRSCDFGESAIQCGLDRLTDDGVVIAPADDPRAMRAIRDHGARVVTYGVRQAADVSAKIIEQEGGVSTLLVSHEDTSVAMETNLCGAAMAANQMAATTFGLLIDFSLPDIVQSLGKLREIPGRGQRLVDWGQATVVLDAAGSPERASASLRTQRSMKGRGQLWCVLAIDCQEAPVDLARYGDLLERFADRCVLTAKPGSKAKFLSATHCVLDGVKDCAALRLVADHRRAIEWAIQEAKPQDTILILGSSAGTTAIEQRSEAEQLSRLVGSIRGQLTDQVTSDREASECHLKIFHPED